MDKFGYKTVEIIGAGSFGTVYKCIDGNNNACCVKRIELMSTSTTAASVHFQMVQHEIYLLQHLAHPRIISLHEYFCSQNDLSVHIVMEYAALGPLSKFIAYRCGQKKFLEENKIKRFLIDMVLGIEFLHMKNVVHKDLKPCNILICENERLKIADFGISKIKNVDSLNSNDRPNSNGTKEAAGSPIYMAPETLIYNHFTFASDIWALGCILYELCLLESAFGHVESMDDLIRCTLTKECISIVSKNPGYDDKLISLCDFMMTADVKQRATIIDVIKSPFLIIQYYDSYFQYNAESVQNICSTVDR